MITSHASIQVKEARQLIAPVLRPDLLCRIHDLNRDYLELLARERTDDGCAGQLEPFAPKLKPTFAALASDQRARVAATPYTLYSLRFEDVRFWRAARNPTNESIDERYSLAASATSIYDHFREVALIQAWHIASTQPLAARVLYSMGEAVRESLAALLVWQVRRIAGEHPTIMKPRWPTNPCFWPDLLAFARSGDSLRLAATQLLGTQLIAAELFASSGRVTK